jgi:hypothetical protein
MDDTMLESGSGAPVTPTSMIVTGGIFPLGVSSQMTGLNYSNLITSTNKFPPLVIGPTQAMTAVASLPSTKKYFLYSMSSMDMLNGLYTSQSMSHVSSVSSCAIFSPYEAFPWGRVHITLSSPVVGSWVFSSSIPNLAWGWIDSMGSGYKSTTMPSTLTPFTMYGGFESNHFTSYVVLAGGNPFQIQSSPMQGHFSLQGAFLGGTPLQG